MQPEHLLYLPKAHTSIHIGAVTVVLHVDVEQRLIDGLREAKSLISALLRVEEGKLNAGYFDLGLPPIEWPAGVELPGGGDKPAGVAQ